MPCLVFCCPNPSNLNSLRTNISKKKILIQTSFVKHSRKSPYSYTTIKGLISASMCRTLKDVFSSILNGHKSRNLHTAYSQISRSIRCKCTRNKVTTFPVFEESCLHAVTGTSSRRKRNRELQNRRSAFLRERVMEVLFIGTEKRI